MAKNRRRNRAQQHDQQQSEPLGQQQQNYYHQGHSDYNPEQQLDYLHHSTTIYPHHVAGQVLVVVQDFRPNAYYRQFSYVGDMNSVMAAMGMNPFSAANMFGLQAEQQPAQAQQHVPANDNNSQRNRGGNRRRNNQGQGQR
jgi:hypothetical protein